MVYACGGGAPLTRSECTYFLFEPCCTVLWVTTATVNVAGRSNSVAHRAHTSMPREEEGVRTSLPLILSLVGRRLGPLPSPTKVQCWRLVSGRAYVVDLHVHVQVLLVPQQIYHWYRTPKNSRQRRTFDSLKLDCSLLLRRTKHTSQNKNKK